jgi:hypothetical protein
LHERFNALFYMALTKEAELFYELEKKDEDDQRDSRGGDGGGVGEDMATIE